MKCVLIRVLMRIGFAVLYLKINVNIIEIGAHRGPLD